MSDNKLLGPGGLPLKSPEPNLIVIKSAHNASIPPTVLSGLSKITKSAVIQLPLSSELMMGTLAQKELESTHTAVHAICNLPNINFTSDELTILRKAMKFLISQTGDVETCLETSPESKLLNKIIST